MKNLGDAIRQRSDEDAVRGEHPNNTSGVIHMSRGFVRIG
jgi:hypothetical protein